jgi:hypothetical protein
MYEWFGWNAQKMQLDLLNKSKRHHHTPIEFNLYIEYLENYIIKKMSQRSTGEVSIY